VFLRLYPDGVTMSRYGEDSWKAGAVFLGGLCAAMLVNLSTALREHQLQAERNSDDDEGGQPAQIGDIGFAKHDNAVLSVDFPVTVETPTPRGGDPEREDLAEADISSSKVPTGTGIGGSSDFKIEVMTSRLGAKTEIMRSDEDKGMLCPWKDGNLSIIFGDVFYNLVNGMLIAAAFQSCSEDSGWTVMATVLVYEIPQELGDYLVLISAGFTPGAALCCNFFTSLSAIVGCLAMLGDGSIDESVLGFMLLFGAGIYAYVAAADLLGRGVGEPTTWLKVGLQALCFILGILVVALTLFQFTTNTCSSGYASRYISQTAQW